MGNVREKEKGGDEKFPREIGGGEVCDMHIILSVGGCIFACHDI